MTLKELADVQRRFDEQHESDFQWDTMISQDNIPMLGFTLLALSGEVGETSNLVKKIWTGDCSLCERRADLQEEIADIFAYLLKLTYQLDFDLEQAYLEKNRKNYERFAKYARDNG